MMSACVEILPHMDTMMVLSALVRDMVAAEWELGVLRTGVRGAQPPGSPYIRGARVGARLWSSLGEGRGPWGVGLLSDPVTVGSQGPVGLVG